MSIDNQARQVVEYINESLGGHLKTLYPDTKIEIFKGMNHGQILVDHPEEVANRITRMLYEQDIIDTSID